VKPIVDAGLADGTPKTFVQNALVIAVPRGNPRHIAAPADLGRAGVTFAACAPEVPCGSAAAKALRAARVSAHPVTLERDVKAVLTKVALGEVDAGFVYRTDVRAEPDRVGAVEFTESAAAINDYPIVRLTSGHDGQAAQAFIDYVLSPAGRDVLTAAGFMPAS
jgi:molybdate transport system substrate-binding protein